MANKTCKLVITLLFFACPALQGHASDATVQKELQSLGVSSGSRAAMGPMGPPAAGGAPGPVSDADVAKANFTLRDVNGKKWTLSALKGKIVLVNFWAWSAQCATCHQEMLDLDLIYTHYQSQGLVILSVITTPDDLLDLNHLVTYLNYHPPVLLDNGGKVGQAFHIDSRPRSFVFDRDGKLVAQSLDICTQRQFSRCWRKPVCTHSFRPIRFDGDR